MPNPKTVSHTPETIEEIVTLRCRCFVEVVRQSPPARDANQLLFTIAYCPLHTAAPALLEAARDFVSFFEGIPEVEGRRFTALKAAIRQATGGENNV